MVFNKIEPSPLSSLSPLSSPNTVEGYFSILKRGIIGIYHHVSKEHLQRYLAEFDFRYNGKNIDDMERAELAIIGGEGKRLMYRDSSSEARIAS